MIIILNTFWLLKQHCDTGEKPSLRAATDGHFKDLYLITYTNSLLLHGCFVHWEGMQGADDICEALPGDRLAAGRLNVERRRDKIQLRGRTRRSLSGRLTDHRRNAYGVFWDGRCAGCRVWSTTTATRVGGGRKPNLVCWGIQGRRHTVANANYFMPKSINFKN